MAPNISVVMPVRNGQAYLRAALDSILTQSFGDFEFLIVDDGSNDDTPAILAAAAQSDRRIRVLRSTGSGIVAALNLGLASATGIYVARMDADDVSLPGRFAAQLAVLDAMPGLAAIGSAATEIDAGGKAGGHIGVPLSADDVRAALHHTNPIIHPTVMMRREAVERVGLYRNALTHAEDYDLWLRLSRIGDIVNLAEPLLNFRRHGDQISTTKRLDQRAATALARQLSERSEAGYAEPDDMSVTLHMALRRHLLDVLRDPRPLARGDGKDIAVMLRAASRAKLMSSGEMVKLGRRLGLEARLPKAWLLPFQLWLGR